MSSERFRVMAGPLVDAVVGAARERVVVVGPDDKRGKGQLLVGLVLLAMRTAAEV